VHRFGEVLYDLYGSTETGWVTIATPDDERRKPGSVGRPGRGMSVVVADDDGRVLPPGEPGRVYVRTGGEFEGYTSGETKARLGDAVDTGDAGWVDEDGYLYVAGRADDTIVTGGENVHAGEIEAVLDAHRDVRESAVVGVPDEEYGQVPAAFVVRRARARTKPETLRRFVRERLARYKVPRHVVFVDELPRNATGKVLKRVLAAEEFTKPS
jgi:fatty-acyl-CoA synthase